MMMMNTSRYEQLKNEQKQNNNGVPRTQDCIQVVARVAERERAAVHEEADEGRGGGERLAQRGNKLALETG